MSDTIQVNGAAHTVDVEGDTPLLCVLRDSPASGRRVRRLPLKAAGLKVSRRTP